MDHEIENVIRGYRDDDLDGRLKYLCDESFADPSYCYDHDYGIPGRFDIFGPAAEVDFFTDANQEENHFLFMDKLHFMLATHLELFQDFDIQKIPLQPM